MRALKTDRWSEPRRPDSSSLNELDPETRDLLGHLRLSALKCRSAARTDMNALSKAAAMALHHDKAHQINILLPCLAHVLPDAPVFYRPGVTAVSFDEAWLMRTIQSAARADWDSVAFLLRSRVPVAGRRNLAGILISLSRHLAADTA